MWPMQATGLWTMWRRLVCWVAETFQVKPSRAEHRIDNHTFCYVITVFYTFLSFCHMTVGCIVLHQVGGVGVYVPTQLSKPVLPAEEIGLCCL